MSKNSETNCKNKECPYNNKEECPALNGCPGYGADETQLTDYKVNDVFGCENMDRYDKDMEA